MISIRAVLSLSLAAFLTVTPAFAIKTHHASSSTHKRSAHKVAAHTRSHSRRHSRSHRLHGQQEIQPERVKQIQQALVREHYLTEEPNGDWDAATQAAMQKYQSDQGWQTRLMPDARALVKLGLGPDYSQAINARDSSSFAPPPASAVPTQEAAGFAEASGVNQ